MNQVFYDPVLENEFAVHGYVTLPLLDKKEVQELHDAYDQLEKPASEGFHCSMFSPDVHYRKHVDALIKEAVSNKLDSVLVNYRQLCANFMVKEPEGESDWFVHQDWTFVDETKSTSLAVWTPLTDVGAENGALYVVPGSHKIENMIRGPGVPDPYKNLHQVIREKYSKMVPLKAGQAILWHHRLVHFSPSNLSSKVRVAPTIIMVPSNAPVFHYLCQDKNEIQPKAEKFEVDTDFFMHYSIREQPQKVESSGMAYCSFQEVTENQLYQVLTEKPNHDGGFINKIQRLFTKSA